MIDRQQPAAAVVRRMRTASAEPGRVGPGRAKLASGEAAGGPSGSIGRRETSAGPTPGRHAPGPSGCGAFAALHADVTACDRCPRLLGHCRTVAPRAAYAGQVYWNRPVPGFGDPLATLWVIGLAPGAHGANRTGRVFTGDRSGDFLYAALHRAGYASRPTSTGRDDGMTLAGCYVSGAARCAPPANRPTPAEVGRCGEYLDREYRLLTAKRVLLALGGIAWAAGLDLARRQGWDVGRPVFGHGAEVTSAAGLMLVGSYHVSQQNTFTGRLTTAMFDRVVGRCRELGGQPTGVAAQAATGGG